MSMADEIRPARNSLVAWLVVGLVAFGSCVGLRLCDDAAPTDEVTPPPERFHDARGAN